MAEIRVNPGGFLKQLPAAMYSTWRQTHAMNPAVQMFYREMKAGTVEYPNPYTEVRWKKTGGGPAWLRPIMAVYGIVLLVTLGSFMLHVGSTPEGVTTLPNWMAVEIFGYPLALWIIGGYFGMAGLAIAVAEPVELKKTTRMRGPPSDYWDTVWNAAAASCNICSGPLIPGATGLRCRECGRGYNWKGEMRDNTVTNIERDQ